MSGSNFWGSWKDDDVSILFACNNARCACIKVIVNEQATVIGKTDSVVDRIVTGSVRNW